MDSRIERAFALAARENRGALVGFLTVGDPTPSSTVRLSQALIEGGVDILELGIPFSDPIADGPTIQAADLRSLEAGTTTDTCLETARHIINRFETPIVFLSYYNPIFRYGVERFMKMASKCVDGLVVPDLPEMGSEDFLEYKRLARRNHLAMILLASPTTSEVKLKSLTRESDGFLYLVSLLGVTGVRREYPKASLEFIKRVSSISNGVVKVAVGFGVSSPEQVTSVLKAGADGVIVGSAFVNIVASNLQDIDSATLQLKQFTKTLREATKLR